MRQSIYIKSINLKRVTASVFVGIVLLFLLASLFVTSMKNTKSYYIHQWFEKMSYEGFIKAFEYENGHFKLGNESKKDGQPITNILFSFITNIRLYDPKSLLVHEISSMTKFENNILVAGEGIDFTNLPIESSLTLAEINQNPNVKDPVNEPIKNPANPPSKTTNGKDVFFIYHTHSWESFLPLIPGAKEPNQASSPKVNVSLLGERLKNNLEANGIGAIDDKTNIGAELTKRHWDWGKSYKMSRLVVENALSQDKDLNYLIDIHRDDQRGKVTTTEIDGQKYAKLYFIVGVENKNYQKNLALAKDLNSEIMKFNKGLTRGIYSKNYKQGNGVYNQDLSPNSILIEVGGVDNTLPELYRTIDLLSDILSKYYWDHQ
ncbi:MULTISPECIES: stage II sporulation protein P [unclassified Bacillus (in: firmicutes)]|uniref:stage II sporulation protein P n=1 Tax=unclassified Bacillus (in: firmicutes) TaxID=185979 RepID=UPI000BF07BF8|nr:MULTISPECIES: stage II sporulation protein P [unclassified Bacillus (in: firmicutes)]PEJ48528.1 stage II sporulation protein P [Bacillus sp. AFS002410]PEK99897.1 stage II sporulation protein P [Bacillus sp. AFS017336]